MWEVIKEILWCCTLILALIFGMVIAVVVGLHSELLLTMIVFAIILIWILFIWTEPFAKLLIR